MLVSKKIYRCETCRMIVNNKRRCPKCGDIPVEEDFIVIKTLKRDK